jgi:hypothetical protein
MGSIEQNVGYDLTPTSHRRIGKSRVRSIALTPTRPVHRAIIAAASTPQSNKPLGWALPTI